VSYLRADSLDAGLSQALSHYPEIARLVGVEKPKTELDAGLERIGGMTEADREALLSALSDPPKGKKGKKTGCRTSSARHNALLVGLSLGSIWGILVGRLPLP